METKKLQSFKDLNVWQKSSDLATLVYKITKKFPQSELYGLTNQMRRAVISISSNIAEGFKRNHKKEKLQFYNVAYGSAAELESQIEISYKLAYLSKENYQKLLSLTIEVSKMIDGLIKSVRKFLNSKFYFLFPLIFLYSIFYILIPSAAEAAKLYLSPQSQTIYQGDSFVVTVWVDTEGEDINAIEGHLNFPQDKLEIIDIGKGGSILNLWPEEPFYSNQTGEISFIGGIPGGFQGQGGLLSIIFRVNPRVAPRESASITFKDDSKILLNDGEGTSAQLTFVEGSYEVTEKPEGMPVITSKSHPDQGRWYKESTLYLYWKLEKEAEYSWILSYDPLAEPDEIPDKPKPKGELTWMGAIEYTGLEDGIYYFHLRQKLPNKAWSKKITFRTMIDTMPPEDFEPKIAKDPTVFDGKYFLSFATRDKTSGVDHYKVLEEVRKSILENLIAKLGRKEHRIPKGWKIAESPYLLEDQSLQSKISVKAIDKAGNERIAEIIPSYKVTWEDVLFLVILVLIVVGVVWRIIRGRIKKQESRIRNINI